ncbi:MAG: 50S ribosomal protein L11 methyltransferase [Chitinophagaceae bacterium]|nr:50S ribosomal protein L11 methyltransferase [Chitinophagaceae bacterium]
MSKEFVQLFFSNVDAGKTEMLIALLSNIGYSGFEETDNGLKSYISHENFNEDDLNEITNAVDTAYERSFIKEQNWNATWESSFDPIIIGDFAAIRAAFHQPVQNMKHEIIITPKMSFGTGHHATTYMMIEQMSGMDIKSKSVVDFGTGTAVLAILAEKMGALSVDAIDNDDWSIENARENIGANNCHKINISKADALLTGKTYDIILANINLNVIVDNLPGIIKAAQKGTEILLSGFLKQDEADLIKLLSVFNLSHINTLQKEEWICLKLKMD